MSKKGWKQRLDKLVHEEKAGEAQVINRTGIDAQIDYLLGVASQEDSPHSLEFGGQYLRTYLADLREQFADVPEVLAAIERCGPGPSGMEEG